MEWSRILGQVAEMLDSRTLVNRLRRKTVAGQPVFPTPIELEAAHRIEKLEAALRLIAAARDVRDCNDIARSALAGTE